MNDNPSLEIESDPRFPSGLWTGFFLQKSLPGKHLMDLRLTFRNGGMIGEGRDWVGEFTVKGQYNLTDGKCWWHKKYVGKHDVFYDGFNEGKGIWGVWEIGHPSIGVLARGGFHIWPEGMGNPSLDQLSEEADPPIAERDEASELAEIGTN